MGRHLHCLRTILTIGIHEHGPPPPGPAHRTCRPVSALSAWIPDTDRTVATTSDIDIKNLPHLTKEDMKDLLTPEIRVRIPNYNQLCFSFLGAEFFKVCLTTLSRTVRTGEVVLIPFYLKNPCSQPKTYRIGVRPLHDPEGKTYNDALQLDKTSITIQPGQAVVVRGG